MDGGAVAHIIYSLCTANDLQSRIHYFIVACVEFIYLFYLNHTQCSDLTNIRFRKFSTSACCSTVILLSGTC